MSLWDTAGNIVNDAAVELGLIAFQAKPTDPFGSNDANIGQLCQLTKSVGRDLQRRRAWSHLLVSYTFDTVAGTSTYDLPSDFGRILSQSLWNRTNRLPLGGPLSPQEWEYLKGQAAGIVFTVLFRLYQGKIQLYPDVNTPGGYTLAFEYVSRWWVQPQGQTVGTADAPTASTDTILFDPHLFKAELKLALWRAKGFDTTALEQDAEAAFEQACAEDTPARTLNLSRGDILRQRFIDDSNIPITGFGS